MRRILGGTSSLMANSVSVRAYYPTSIPGDRVSFATATSIHYILTGSVHRHTAWDSY